tara:strand:- start:633 stop:779 length:147 start_codon:yes stop_codon:yes gene_type:complete
MLDKCIPHFVWIFLVLIRQIPAIKELYTFFTSEQQNMVNLLFFFYIFD